MTDVATSSVPAGPQPFVGDFGYRLAQIGCLALGAVLILHASLRGVHADLDAFAYREWYESFGRVDWREFVRSASGGIYFESQLPYRFEIGFALLAFASVTAGLDAEGFFFLCAAASLVPKVIVIARHSATPLATLLWYASWYYVLLEMNAMRAGIAAAILVLGIRHLLSGNMLRFAPFVAVACTFHVSAISAVLLIACRWVRLDVRLVALMVAVSVTLSFVPIVSVLEPLAGLSSKLRDYLTLLRQGDVFTTINVFNVLTLSRLVLLGALMFAISRVRTSALEQVGIWSLALSLAIYFSFASFPVVAGRLSEFVGIFQIFVAPVFLRSFTPTWLVRAGIAVLMFAQFWAVTFHSRLADVFYFTEIEWLRVTLAVFE